MYVLLKNKTLKIIKPFLSTWFRFAESFLPFILLHPLICPGSQLANMRHFLKSKSLTYWSQWQRSHWLLWDKNLDVSQKASQSFSSRLMALTICSSEGRSTPTNECLHTPNTARMAFFKLRQNATLFTLNGGSELMVQCRQLWMKHKKYANPVNMFFVVDLIKKISFINRTIIQLLKCSYSCLANWCYMCRTFDGKQPLITGLPSHPTTSDFWFIYFWG